MAYTVAPDKGLHFSFGPWKNCCIFAYDAGVGDVVMVGVGAEGAAEYDSLGFIFGPGSIQVAVTLAGSFGGFLLSLIPQANTLMKALLDTHPAFAPVTNADPPTIDNTNVALEEYFKIEPSVDGEYPVMSFKPYQP